MEITQTAAAATTTSSSALATSAETVSSDFDTFLKMMTAQVQNQDPLNPIDSADYAVQLATFSSVEQQVKTNDLLVALAAQMGGVGLTQAAQWVGMEARVAAPVAYSGEPLTLSPNPAAAADDVRLIVRDASGNQVQTQNLAVSAQQVEWTGVVSGGGTLPNGNYSFEIESRQNGAIIDTSAVEVYATVAEARSENGATMLVLESGSLVEMAEVSAIRRSQ